MKKHWSEYRFFQLGNQTPEMCLELIKEYGNCLYYVKEKFKTRELCKIAIEQDKDAIKYVPKEYEDIHRMWKIMYE